jgi:hypothetical protein
MYRSAMMKSRDRVECVSADGGCTAAPVYDDDDDDDDGDDDPLMWLRPCPVVLANPSQVACTDAGLSASSLSELKLCIPSAIHACVCTYICIRKYVLDYTFI